MKIAKRIVKAITIIAGFLLVLSISGYDEGTVANTVLIVTCTTWLTTILLINYGEAVKKYG